MKTTLLSTVLLVSGTLVVPPTVHAAETGFYFGATAGVYTIEQDELDEDDSELLKAFAGFQVNPWLGIEAAWLDFNRTTEQANNFESDGYSVAAVLSLPMGKRSSFFVKGGHYWWDADTTVAGISVRADGNDSLWGAGFNFGFNDHIHLRIEYEQYEVGDFDIEAASAGLQFTF
jgi:OmpA-OmpF porin, OOP family